ncbi:MAG: transglycosylase SLT domain-containing protein [Alphaproteobacteria bacterium]
MRVIAAVAAILASLSTAALAAGPAAEGPCAAAVASQERAFGIPDHLLASISLVESGRWDEASRATIAWPWTINAGGVGTFFPTKAAAIAEVRRLRKEGVRSIDVGCMQVNLMYHPDAFSDLEEAFDPAGNAAYAAGFLSRLHDAAGSWIQAAANYHSMDPDRGDHYREKVARTWSERRGTAVAADEASGARPVAAAYRPQTGGTAPIIPLSRDLEERMAAANAQRLEKAARTQAEALEAQRAAQAWREARLREYLDQKAQRIARLSQAARRL